MVSDDKPEYLVKNARIICHHQLLQRQLLRLRQDLDLVSKDEIELDGVEFDSREEIEQLEAMRTGGAIDGYVAKRSQYNLLRAKLEGIRLVCTKDHERSRFVPPPLNGFTLLVGRVGFPKSRVEHILDSSAEFAYHIESQLLESIPSDLVNLTGIHVEQRGVGTILRGEKKQR